MIIEDSTAPALDVNASASQPLDSQSQSQAEQPQQAEAQVDHDDEALFRARAENAQALQDSREDVWYLKEMAFEGKRKKIVTQNYNGPCSFIAICNILILRGDIEILPPERTSVSYDFLAQLLGDYLLHASPDADVSAALTMMPLTQKGMDLNPLFTSHEGFRPAGDAGALRLFEQAHIRLVHGWLADPSSPEYRILSSVEDYDNAVNLIVEADTLSKGQLVVDENLPGPSAAGPSSTHASETLSQRDQRKIEDALHVRNFLDSTASQLTYHGLFTLASSLEPGSLVALFRNSHLSVLHRHSDEDGTGLYNLVTDFVFYNEPAVVWERLEDVDGSATTFVDGEFRKSSPAGGDFAGHTAPLDPSAFAEFDPADQELARQLQAEEDAHAAEAYARRQQQQAERRRMQEQQQYQNGPNGERQHPYDPRFPREQQYDPRFAQQRPSAPMKMKKEKSCVIM